MTELRVALSLELATDDGPPFSLDVLFSSDALTTLVFGPSGSGKTTLLRSVAGLESPRRGQITFGNRTLLDTEAGLTPTPRERGTVMLFQQPTLFPHLTALDNVLFAASGDRSEAEAFLARFHVSDAATRYPRELSGGEQQRVSMARALAARPRLLLLDEPLSAVDSETRATILQDLRSYQQDHQTPFLYVTHNRVEALAIGGTAILLDRGRVLRQGPAAELFQIPGSADAARVLGPANVLSGIVAAHRPEEGLSEVRVGELVLATPITSLPEGTSVAATIPSDDVIVSADAVGRTSARNVVQGTVGQILELERGVELVVRTPEPIRARISRSALSTLQLQEGSRVHLMFKAMAIVVEPI